jgi:hypothetical protein
MAPAGDRFDSDCVVGTQFESSQPHHAVLRKRGFPGSVQIAPNSRRFVHAFCLCNLPIGLLGAVRGLCLCPGKLRFPTAKMALVESRFECWVSAPGKPSISRCLDHSAGKSVRRATPMPCGSRPSMAALMRSGARKASEIVMLTFRALQLSRFAMLSLDIDASVVSSGPTTQSNANRDFPVNCE